MLAAVLSVLVLLLSPAATLHAADSSFDPLWAYNGAWKITKQGSGKPEDLVNQCALFGKYFACQQSVNGTPSELLVFTSTNTPGEYHTQSVMPDGRAGGRGDLKVEGDKWTFSSYWNQGGGKAIFYKTVNVFTGKTRIHFEQQESTDRQEWKSTGSGDEVRMKAGSTTIVH